MAGESVLSGFVNIAAYIGAEASPYFRTSVVMLPLLNIRNFREKTPGQPGSASLKFGKKGNLTAYVTNEAAAITKSTYTQTSVSITAQKVGVYVELTDEAETFGNEDADPDALAQEAGLAIADKFDTDALALTNGFSNSVGSTGVALTIANFKLAPYKVRLNKVKGRLAAVLHPTAVRDIGSDLIATAAPVWSGGRDLDILNGQPPEANGYAGSLFNVPIYESSNCKSINAGADWSGGVFHPQYAICAGMLGRVKVIMQPNAQNVLQGMSVFTYYNMAELNDGAGCEIVSAQ